MPETIGSDPQPISEGPQGMPEDEKNVEQQAERERILKEYDRYERKWQEILNNPDLTEDQKKAMIAENSINVRVLIEDFLDKKYETGEQPTN